jgi:hypothetical protein
MSVSFGGSQDVIVALPGADSDVAKWYPEDERYLLEFETTVAHYDLFE